MRKIREELQVKLDSGNVQMSYCLTLFRNDGTWIHLTNCDCDIPFNGFSFLSLPGISVSNIQSGQDLSPDNFNVVIPFDDNVFTRDSVIAERYSDGTFVMFLVDRKDTANYINVGGGYVGEVKVRDGFAEIEMLSHIERLNYEVGNEISPKCRAVFGDSYCKKNLQEYTVGGVVKTVTSGSKFTAYLHAIPYSLNGTTWVLNDHQSDWEDDSKEWFTYGSLLFTLGVIGQSVGDYLATLYGAALNDTLQNNNIKRTIRAYNWTDSIGVFVLSKSAPYPILPGDTFFAVAGCNKSKEKCEELGNIESFQGEPDLPTKDTITGQ